MPSNYWLKLYHELLHDPKMARLDSDTWRRCIEMFLFAGERGTKQGYLPAIADMAWVLHATEEALAADIEALIDLDLLSHDEQGMVYVTQFESRQAPASAAARQKRYRERSHKAQHYGNEPRNEPVTTRNTELDIDIDTEKREIQSTDVPAAVAAPPPPPKRKRRSRADPRTKHPAIQAVKAVLGGRRNPPIEMYDELITVLGDSPNLDLLTTCRCEWMKRGYNGNGWAWATDWYKTDGPKDNRARASPANKLPEQQYDWAELAKANRYGEVGGQDERENDGADQQSK